MLVARTTGTLQAAGSTIGLVQAAAHAVRALTGFDRVWAYRFEADDHGVVVAEDRDERLESFLGLHYPASDIPVQARALFMRNGVRVIPDAQAAPVSLEPELDPETGAWLDMSDGALRAVSPMHLRYLGNMGVRASMSIALTVRGRLWGLLSAHHYAGPRTVPAAMRAACELIGLMTSLQLDAKRDLEHARASLELERSVARLMEAVAVAPTIVQGLTADPPALLGACAADGAIVAIGGRLELVGATPGDADARRILRALEHEGFDAVVALDSLGERDPGLAPLAATAAGALALPLSREHGNWIVWLRGEQLREVTWGHRDKALLSRDAAGELELGPRESFERWAETVQGHSRPWDAPELEAARSLRTSVGALILARAEELERLNVQLAKSNAELDTFAFAAAHDLQEPLRGIHNYALFLEEDYGDVLDAEARERLTTIMRLVQRSSALIASLLDYARVGRVDLELEDLDLAVVVGDVRELLHGRLTERGARIDVTPAPVRADRDRLGELLANLIANAVKYTPGDAPVVEVGTCAVREAGDVPGRIQRALGVGYPAPTVYFVRDHGIGIAPEHHEAIFALFRRLHGREDYGGGAGAGLTLARRIVERHGGMIWVESAPEQGTTMFFTLEPA